MIRTFVIFAVMPTIASACGTKMSAASDTVYQARETRSMATSAAEKVEVWVVLTEAPIAAAPKGQLDVVKRQQDAVMAQLKALGATELARVTTSNNALAVAIDPARIAEVRRIAGVRSVSAIQHIEREPVPTPPPVR